MPTTTASEPPATVLEPRVLTPNQQVRNRIARTAMEILAESDDSRGVHKDDLWRQVKERYPEVDRDWARHANAKSGPFVFLTWHSSGLSPIGWLYKDGWGHWRITGAGRWSLEEYPSLDAWAAAIDQRYQDWSRKRDRFEQAEKLLSSLPEDS